MNNWPQAKFEIVPLSAFTIRRRTIKPGKVEVKVSSPGFEMEATHYDSYESYKEGEETFVRRVINVTVDKPGVVDITKQVAEATTIWHHNDLYRFKLPRPSSMIDKSDDGLVWVDWDGRDACPVQGDTPVAVRYDTGLISKDKTADHHYWGEDVRLGGYKSEIVAYAVITEKQKQEDVTWKYLEWKKWDYEHAPTQNGQKVLVRVACYPSQAPMQGLSEEINWRKLHDRYGVFEFAVVD